MKPLACFSLVCSILSLSMAAAKPSHNPPTPNVPSIARIAGFTVGVSSIEAMERRLGPGYAYTGGHPQGAREWVSRQTGWVIDADGFNYLLDGRRVVETLSISTTKIDRAYHPPVVSLPRTKLMYMGLIELGMTKQRVLSLMSPRLGAPSESGSDLCWSKKGFKVIDRYPFDNERKWTLSFHFENNRLTEISVDVYNDRA